MGLFSFLSKNKQEAAGEDSTFYANADEASLSAKARSKRASSAGDGAPRRGREGRGAADPGLPEKKRARRRLVGAVALALAVAIGLPMVLDSEPKPLASDIAIQIPSKDKLSLTSALSQDAVNNPAVKSAAKETQEQLEREQAAAAEKAAAEQAAAADKAAQQTPAAKEPSPKEQAAKEQPAKEHPAKEQPAKEQSAKETALKEKAAPAAKAEEKPAHAAKPAESNDAVRATAILEGKAPDADGPKFMVQVAALASPEKIAELQEKLKAAGMKPSTQKVPTESGERTRIRVGPFGRDEAEKVRARLIKMGLNGSLVPA
jgi:DedD protein